MFSSKSLFVLSSLCGVLNAVLFSPYKDVGTNANWWPNEIVISTSVTGSPTLELTKAMSIAGIDTMTWAFAVGECGHETWATIAGSAVAQYNVPTWSKSGKKYIISTGGAAGNFRCATSDGLKGFIDRYNSASLVGIDFDIERSSQNGGDGLIQSEIDSLIAAVKVNQGVYPQLRFSFTLAAAPQGTLFNAQGLMVMESIKRQGLTGHFINLMTMDYGTASPNTCVMKADGSDCDMGLSATKCAEMLNAHPTYPTPYASMELTPLTGVQDTGNSGVFGISDVKTISAFALAHNLGGLHFWSFDRDTDCDASCNNPTQCCDGYKAGVLGFTKAFQQDLGLSPAAARLHAALHHTKAKVAPAAGSHKKEL